MTPSVGLQPVPTYLIFFDPTLTFSYLKSMIVFAPVSKKITRFSVTKTNPSMVYSEATLPIVGIIRKT